MSDDDHNKSIPPVIPVGSEALDQKEQEEAESSELAQDSAFLRELEAERFRLECEEKTQRIKHDEAEFALKCKAEEQRIKHEQENHPFFRDGKKWITRCALGYILFLSSGLGYYVLTHKFLEASWHVSVLLFSGAFLSIFGLFAILLRGIFQSEREASDPPVSLSEVVKTIAGAVKSLKGGD